jgi:hypothetical protein
VCCTSELSPYKTPPPSATSFGIKPSHHPLRKLPSSSSCFKPLRAELTTRVASRATSSPLEEALEAAPDTAEVWCHHPVVTARHRCLETTLASSPRRAAFVGVVHIEKAPPERRDHPLWWATTCDAALRHRRPPMDPPSPLFAFRLRA